MALCNFCAEVYSSEMLLDVHSNLLLKEKVDKYLPCFDIRAKAFEPVHMCVSCKATLDKWNVFFMKCIHVQRSIARQSVQNISDDSVNRKRRKVYCCAKYCTNTNFDEKMFHLPKNIERAKQWLLNADRSDVLKETIRLEDLKKKNLTFCRQHFESKMFNNDLKLSLVSVAVPTLFNVSAGIAKSSKDPSEMTKCQELEKFRKIAPKPRDIELLAKLPENKENKTSNLLIGLKQNNDPSASEKGQGELVSAESISSEHPLHQSETERIGSDVPDETDSSITESRVVLGDHITPHNELDSNAQVTLLETIDSNQLKAINFHSLDSSGLDLMSTLENSDCVIMDLLSEDPTSSAAGCDSGVIPLAFVDSANPCLSPRHTVPMNSNDPSSHTHALEIPQSSSNMLQTSNELYQTTILHDNSNSTLNSTNEINVILKAFHEGGEESKRSIKESSKLDTCAEPLQTNSQIKLEVLASAGQRSDEHIKCESKHTVESHEEQLSSLSSYSVLDYDTSRLLNTHLVSSRMLMYSCEFCGDTLLTEGLLQNHCKLYHSM